MSTGTPEKLIPRHLDPRKAAQQRAVYDGRIPAEALPRLQRAVETIDAVSAHLQFRISEQGQKVVEGSLVADIKVTCQRCLEPLPYRTTSDFSLAAVWNEDQAKQLPSGFDPWITDEGEGDLYEILEEELLLSLPLVAYHEEECVDSALFSSGESPAGDSSRTETNPFQVLKQLKGNIKK